VTSWPLAVAREVRHRWRRSLQLRMVTTTLVLSAVVTVLIGITVLHQVQSGLLGAANRSALSQLGLGVDRAQSQFSALPRTDRASVERTAFDVAHELTDRGVSNNDDYDVVMLSTSGLRSYAPNGVTSSIPAQLKAAVTRTSSEVWSYTQVTRNGGTEPGLVVGAPVQAAGLQYQIFYVFPLTREAQTIDLVERTMLLAGAALVLLLAGIAALVTRQVVRPVRQAAVTAERLAAGRLKERMSVRGEDDLATLAASFNRMADTVQRQILQLRELSRVQRRFVADVSHELRTPITTIRMAADLLHDAMADLPPELARSTELLQLQLDRFELLLADLLEISRHDAGAAVLEAEPTDLGHLVGNVVATATPLALARSSDLRAAVPVTPVIVDVDARRIDRVLRNLVENAIEHAEGGPVEVRLVPGETAVAMTVRDYGIGLKPGESSLVFGRFWRADPARTRTTGGTGLGLSIALEDTRLHGGWLQAWGEPGRGSVFRLTLPWRTGGVIVESPLSLNPDEEPAGVVPGVRHG
jgi:two-component system sensor histidine kinase MtrB